MAHRTSVMALAGLLLIGAGASVAAQDMASMAPGHHHMSFTAPRAGTPADSAKALAVVRTLRAAIARYPTLAAAQSAGYRSRLPEAMQQRRRMLHVARPKARPARFDPAWARAPRPFPHGPHRPAWFDAARARARRRYWSRTRRPRAGTGG